MPSILKIIVAVFYLVCGNALIGLGSDDDLRGLKVLVYTKNGAGFVHDNIPYAVESVKRLGSQHGFDVEVSDDPRVFDEEKLKDIDFMVFTSTNNDVFDTDAQRLAFRRYMQAGGGLVGIHSVVGTERNWEWFKMMIGGRFVWHPKFQRLKVNILDHSHPSVEGMPNVWEKDDECYLMKELYPGIKVIMAHDLESLNKDQEERVRELAGVFGRYYPAVWHQDFDGGVVWVTALGHHIKDYEDPTFVNHILQGMKFVASKLKDKDFSQAYATDRDSPMKGFAN